MYTSDPDDEVPREEVADLEWVVLSLRANAEKPVHFEANCAEADPEAPAYRKVPDGEG